MATEGRSTYPIDLCFDLDLVLTVPEDSGEVATSESLVSDMPTVYTADVCTVCMEELDAAPGKCGKQMPCGHVYHPTCISTWLSLYDSCPVCRSSVSGHVSESESRKTSSP
ncbi:PREDICTED: E3 ubiquitin-protein ligase RING1-like [Nelumbo nucifera]|uniref:E3 ubiquitin-protein ligase RING1-like n=1 Tax=Nelumbo nucifera TaxID=4432 RepID=A0A1U8Q351_NELNU|nr:PREDICTED: E3 ubiquitin-protein ligase RING1-like [Nelumbo nucifera]